MLELRVLRQFEARLGNVPVLLSSRPAQSLLAYLALTAGTAHRREKLAGLLWPDADEDNARSNLRHALWRIRKALESERDAATYLLTDDMAVTFNAGSDYVLDAAVLTTHRDGHVTTRDLMQDLAVYRGELLPGFYDEWVAPERERLEAVFQHKVRQLVDKLVEEQRWSDLLEWGERWVAACPAAEAGYRSVMLAHGQMGDRGQVGAVFRRCRAALFNDLGVEPSPQTRRLYERLTHSPEPGLEGAPALEPVVERPAEGEPPYLGLQRFTEAEADRFVGRERLTARILERLRTEPFLAVIGASGSGKSSLVRAGLVPLLRSNTGGCEVRLLTPTSRPLDALSVSLLGASASVTDRGRVIGELSRDAAGLRRYLQRTSTAPVALVIDQFEELFTQCRDAFEAEAFVENLLEASEGGQATLLVALRADFYAHCAQHPRLREVIGHHQEYVGQMTAAELRRAIEAPATRGGWELEASLVELLLRDVGEEPGALPLLSHALLETWQRREGRRLTLAGYSASGAVHGAIAQSAERVFNALSLGDQEATHRVFIALTELGEGMPDTRRRARIAELAASQAVLGVLAEARLVTLGEGTVEVAHEALIREWPRLREWLDQDREGLRLHRQLGEAAREWEHAGRDVGALWRGVRLTRALDWAGEHAAELFPAEPAFLDACRELATAEANERELTRQRELDAARMLAETQMRAARKLRSRAVLLTAALVLAFGMAGAAAFFNVQSEQGTLAAQANARSASARELAAAAISNLDVDPDRSLLLALEGVSTTYAVDHSVTSEAESALHRALSAVRDVLIIPAHQQAEWNARLSPDGARIATSSQDGTAKLWDARTGEKLLEFTGHTDSVNGLAFNEDGTRLATSSDDHTAKIWDVRSGRELLTFTGHSGPVNRIAFNVDGRVATASFDHTTRVWDSLSGRELTSLPDTTLVLSVTFSRDGKWLATGNYSGDVTIWDSATYEKRLTLHTNQLDVRAVAFDPTGDRILAPSPGGAKVWDAHSGQELLNVSGHSYSVRGVAFSPGGTRFATASQDSTVKVWDATTGQLIDTLRGHAGPVSVVYFGLTDDQLISSGFDGTARVWDLSLSREALTVPTPTIQAGFAISADGRWMARPFADGSTRVWNALTGEEQLVVSAPTAAPTRSGIRRGVAFSPDSQWLATADQDGKARLWDVATGEQLAVLEGHTAWLHGVAFNPDGRRLATISADQNTRVWDIATGRTLQVLPPPPGAIYGSGTLSFSPDGRLLSFAQPSDGNLPNPSEVWDVNSGQKLFILGPIVRHSSTVFGIAFSPDGSRVATANGAGTAVIWDTVTGQPLLMLPGHTSAMQDVAFSPDGRQLASVSQDGSAQIWDVATGQELLTLTSSPASLTRVAFSPDGRRLITAGADAIRVHVLSIDDLVSLARSRLTRWWTDDECHKLLHRDQCPAQRR